MMIIYLGLWLPTILKRPYPKALGRAILLPSYLDLLQRGFTRPSQLPVMPVRSYRTISPLPAQVELAVYFLWHFPGVSPAGSYPASCPVEPGLSSSELTAGVLARSSGQPVIY